MSDLPIPKNYPYDQTPADQNIDSFPNAIASLDNVAERFIVSATFGQTVGFLLRPTDPNGFYKIAVDKVEAQIQVTVPGSSPKVELTAIFQLPFGTPALVNSVSGYVTNKSSVIMEFSFNPTSIMGGGSMKVKKINDQIVFSISINIAGVAYTVDDLPVFKSS